MAMTLALDARALWMHRSMSTMGYELPPDESVIPWLPSTWSEEDEDERDEYTVEDSGTDNVAKVVEVVKTTSVVGKEVPGVVSGTVTESKTKPYASNPEEAPQVDGQKDTPNVQETMKVTKVSDGDGIDSTAQTNLRGASVAR